MNADVMSGFLGFSALLILFYGPWQFVCVDIFRQYAFEQRDKLFDMAMDGKFSFQSDDYRKARANIEANIRFADRATVARVTFLWGFCLELRRSKAPTFPEPFAKAIRNVRRGMLVCMYMRSAPLVVFLISATPLIILGAIYIYALNRSVRAVYDIAKKFGSVAERSWLVSSVASKAEIEAQCV